MMKKNLILAICSITLISCSNYLSSAQSWSSHKAIESSLIVGDWSGVLNVGLAKVTLVIHIQENADETLKASIDILEQNMNGIVIDSVEFNNKTLKFEIKSAFAKFEGTLTKNDSEISGEWTQAGLSFPLIFERGIKLVKIPKRPQDPQLPLPYIEEQVSYLGPDGILSGTLTLPAAEGLFPAVLLIAGSGANDRDETLLGHKPFLVLANHLTRQGIAVLRFDKRGCGQSTGNYEKATTQDFSDDVLAGIAYLKSRKEIDSNRIGLIGHSEGGIIAPIVAATSKDIAYIVLMAGTGVNGEEILYEQATLIQRAMGESEESINLYRNFQEQMFAIVKKENNTQIAFQQLKKMAKNYLALFPESQQEITLEALEAQAARVNTEWFRYFLTFDPSIALKQVQVPVLALNGELDLQVSSKQNLPAIAKALEDSGNTDVTIIELPKLNHLFQTCETGSIEEYGKIEETMSPLVLNLITEWILSKMIQSAPL